MSDAADHDPTAPGRLLLAVEGSPHTLRPHLRDAWEGGPAVLPLDPRLPPRARGALVAALKPGAIVRPGGLVELPGGVPVPGDVVAVVATSGSTGTPKGVMLTRAALEASARLGLRRTSADPRVPWLCCLPVSHIGGLLVLVRGLITGTAPVLCDTFDVTAVAAVDQPVHLAVVPTMLRRLIAADVDTAGWRTVLVGGARVPAGLRDAVSGTVATYGMSETSGGCVYDQQPLDGVTVTAGPDGRLRIGGPTLMAGYRLAARSGLDHDGMFTTDDIGEVAVDGTVTVLGRADDVIVTGGEKVVATQVAHRISQHPAVAEAAVIGVPDPGWGQRAVAVVVPAQVGAVLSLALLRSFVVDTMPRYAAPQELLVVNALPCLANGKVDRLALLRLVEPEPRTGEA